MVLRRSAASDYGKRRLHCVAREFPAITSLRARPGCGMIPQSSGNGGFLMKNASQAALTILTVSLVANEGAAQMINLRGETENSRSYQEWRDAAAQERAEKQPGQPKGGTIPLLAPLNIAALRIRGMGQSTCFRPEWSLPPIGGNWSSD
jgi:hypothetical protein